MVEDMAYFMQYIKRQLVHIVMTIGCNDGRMVANHH